jgi:hypothetical protein
MMSLAVTLGIFLLAFAMAGEFVSFIVCFLLLGRGRDFEVMGD